MIDSQDSEIEQAKNRLKKAKAKINRIYVGSMGEPNDLVSGVLDEVELKRREKGKDTDE